LISNLLIILTCIGKNKKIVGLLIEFIVFGEIPWLTVYQLVNGHVSQNATAAAMPASVRMSARPSRAF
jgi:hypothetical protein